MPFPYNTHIHFRRIRCVVVACLYALVLTPATFHLPLQLFIIHNNNSPLGFLKRGPHGSEEENFKRYRTVELKHVRVAMTAILGIIMQERSHPGGLLSSSENLSFADVPNDLGDALSVVPLAGWCQIIITLGLHEILVKESPTKIGDYGTGYFGIAVDDQSSKQLRALSVEITNGRLAMLGILGMFASEVVHGEILHEVKML